MCTFAEFEARSAWYIVLATRVLLAVSWGLVIMFLFSAAFDAPFRLSRESKLRLFTLTPEGWAFFTKNPRLPHPRLYKLDGSRWVFVDPHNAAAGNVFGMSRRARKLDIELAAAMGVVKPSEWQRIRATHAVLAANTAGLAEVVLRNTAPHPVLCGRFLVEERPPVPWAWRGSVRKEMPGRAVKLRAVCPPPRRTRKRE